MDASKNIAGRIESLDFLRISAALMVVVYHFTDSQTFDPIRWITTYGYLGVDLFFLISGFVILWSAEGKGVKEFVISRVIRLYPLFWLALAYVAFVMPSTSLQVIANMTMLAGYLGQEFIDPAFWTLQVEFKFYVLIGLLIFLRQKSNFEVWMYLWLVLSVVAQDYPALKTFVIDKYSPYFIAGALCFIIRSQGITLPRGVAYIVCLCLSMSGAEEQSMGFMAGGGSTPAIIVFSIYAVMLGVALDVFRLKCKSEIAAMTYPLYLTHSATGMLVKEYVGHGWLSFAVALVLSLLTSYGLAKLDRPAGQLMRREIERFLSSRPIKMLTNS